MTIATTQIRPSAWTTILSVLIGTCGIMITGVQPLLLGNLLARSIISPSELGIAGALEMFALAAGVVLGSRVLLTLGSYRHIVTAGVAMAALNLLTGWAGAGWEVIALRGLAGIAEGVLIAVVMLAVSHSDRPERLGGLFLSASGPPSLIMAYYLPSYLEPRFGWSIGFTIMAVIGLICAITGLFYRAEYGRHGDEPHARFVFSRPVVLGLAATLLANAAFGACWTYIEPLARLRGMNPTQIGQIVTVGIGGMISGSLAVALSGRHFRALGFLQAAALFQIVTIVLLLGTAHFAPLALAVGGMCFFWQASAPCSIALMAVLDETRTTASLSFPLQLTGLSIGPLMAAGGASGSLSFPYHLGAVLLVATGALLFAVGHSNRQIANVQI